MYLQNALSMNIVFPTVLLLIRDLSSQPEKPESGPIIVESYAINMFSSILKKLD